MEETISNHQTVHGLFTKGFLQLVFFTNFLKFLLNFKLLTSKSVSIF